MLQLSKIRLSCEYCKEWNINNSEFIVLANNGQLINKSIYRVGGIGGEIDVKNYFMLLKYVEAYYSDHILKNSITKDPKYLESRWCIIDKNGIEKVVFEGSLCHPYLVNNSCIYSVEQNYYNIETGEFYCKSYTEMTSSEYLFLNNEFDKDLSKRGVMKINKKDGTWELFSK